MTGWIWQEPRQERRRRGRDERGLFDVPHDRAARGAGSVHALILMLFISTVATRMSAAQGTVTHVPEEITLTDSAPAMTVTFTNPASGCSPWHKKHLCSHPQLTPCAFCTTRLHS